MPNSHALDVEILPNSFSLQDALALKGAVHALENPTFAARAMNRVGQSINLAGRALPLPVAKAIAFATEKSIALALHTALRSLKGQPQKGQPRPGTTTNLMHKALAAGSGAVGGLFGIAALVVELPASTVLMLRSIADIARAEGEDLADPMTAMNCLEVFALGGRPSASHQRDDADGLSAQDAEESGYFAVRALMAKTVSEAARYAAAQGAINETAPVLLRFISQIAARFGIVVSQKIAAQAVPIVGALGGAGVNYAFMAHFQSIAKAHFTVRRLERRYGADLVKSEYERLAQKKN